MANKIKHPKKAAFLAAFGEIGNISTAAELANIEVPAAAKTKREWPK